MSGDTGFDIGGDFDVGADLTPVSSVTDVAGTEFITAAGIDELGLSTAASFEVPYEDVAGFGGYQQVGSFAGDATYNDFFKSGGFLDNPAAVADSTYNDFFNNGGFISGADVARTPGFGFPDVLSPSGGASIGQQISQAAARVQTDFTGFIKGTQEALQAYNKVAPLVNVVTAALKIPNPVNALIQPFQQAVGVAGVVAETAGSVRYVGNALSTPGTVTSGATGYSTAGTPLPGPGQIQNGPVLQISADGAPIQVLPGTGQIVTSAGVPADASFRELSEAETRLLIARNIDPRLVSSFDSGLPSQQSFDTALITRAELGPEEQRLVAEREELKIKQGTNSLKIQELQEDLTDPLVTDREREEITARLIRLQAENGELSQAEYDIQQNIVQTRQQLADAERIIVATNTAALQSPSAVPGTTAQQPFNLVARPSLNVRPGDYPSAVTKQSYDAALLTQAELAPEAERIRAERNEILIKQANIDERIASLEAELADPTLSERSRDEVARELIVAQAERGELEQAEYEITEAQRQVRAQLTEAEAVIAATNASAVPGAIPVAVPPGEQYQTVYNPQNETWSIRDVTTGLTIAANLTRNDTLAAAANLGIQLTGLQLNTTPSRTPGLDGADAAAAAGAGQVFAGNVVTQTNAITAGLTDAARNQQSIRSLRNNKAQSSDWRVRLRLAPNSNYLYNDTQPGVLAPLRVTDGVIFPYTPSIETAYKANYESYDLTHSNYRGYFYKNSYVDAINIRATFTAQDTNEANYLLAVIHFFRSCTKMFYGQDPAVRGAPPPLVYLNGYGDYQFSEHPCLVSQFNYTLPPDVDYVRAQSVMSNNTNLQLARLRNPIANNPLSYSVNRILNSGLLPGAKDFRPSLTGNLAAGEPTYVPTKMEISVSLLPIQSRQQVSQNFSVKEFANGNLLKGGYW